MFDDGMRAVLTIPRGGWVVVSGLASSATPMCSLQIEGEAPKRWKLAGLKSRMAWEVYQPQYELLTKGQGWSTDNKPLQLVTSLCSTILKGLR
ncbi:hypothetical protein E2C01_057871 [Portunus trituberculatus]|uniref:Uncharacterized protein n=1 Tax=Portunus trituberculatus TaxID=210409 RepID=A0A5B7H3T5_PORTR|nr:hypothetical protein [Portunus trituberculatus]